MAPQLQINQGPQDALLFDNTRSYFTNVGYSRTSNFQMELRDIDPQSGANLGSTVSFVMPKAADLLGPVDLMIEFNEPDTTSSGASPGVDKYWGWVESVGYAMIEKITFTVGNHDVEELSGENLNIMNELMKAEQHRNGFHHILKTGRPLLRQKMLGEPNGSGLAAQDTYNTDIDENTHDRIIAFGTTAKKGKKLIIPLGLFFTSHPSKYFPLCSVAGCNDVRISVKFRPINELIMGFGGYTPKVGTGGGVINPATAAGDANLSTIKFKGNGGAFASKGCFLRCHYIHVTGPEATALMNREHVRLMKLWNGNMIEKQFTVSCTRTGSSATLDIPLNFLHPVQELIITIRKVSDMGSSVTTSVNIGTGAKANANVGQAKNYFAYHGAGKDPNIDSWHNCVAETGTSESSRPTYLKTTNFLLKLNGQSRHLDGAGIDRNYMMNRMMPMLHSSASEEYSKLSGSSALGGDADFDMLSQMKDRKEIYCYPFALNPEGANPSGSVNFSKVSHAQLSIGVEGFAPGIKDSTTANSTTDEYVVNVHGVYYNWLAIKDGRALTSFS